MSFMNKAFNTVQLQLRGSSMASQMVKSMISRNKATKAASSVELTSLDQYNAEKKAAKARRTELYNSKMERKKKLRTRRDNKKKNYYKMV